ncbi:MAG: patatin-like phospholipase family protein [Chlorobi bacterium]|nr:patatin-like phospholipase family protein [Chlorobiota bacterium]
MLHKKIHLVLSGGAARGIAHLGVMDELTERGYEIVSVAGTSMGALTGGALAAGRHRHLRDALMNLHVTEMIKLLDFTVRYPGLIKGEKIMKWLSPYLPGKDITRLEMPFTAMAADIRHKTEVAFTSGPLPLAVRASKSIPSVFTPVEDGDRVLVDGGVLNNFPLDRVKATDHTSVVGVWVNADVPCDEAIRRQLPQKPVPEPGPKLHMRDVVIESLHMMMRQNTARLIHDNPPDLLIRIPYRLARFYDFHKAHYIYRAGRLYAAKYLEQTRA